MSVVRKLNDNCFVVATESLASLSKAFEEEMERKPTLAEFAELLSWGARGNTDDLVSDAFNRDITLLGKAPVPKSKSRLKPFDLVAVPLGFGRFAVLLFLGRKRGKMGHTFGVFRRSELLAALNPDWVPDGVFERPIFSGEDYVVDGRWAIVGNRPDLKALFREPELFYDARQRIGGQDWGEFGLAESESAQLRFLTQSEAAEIFGDGPGIKQVFLCDELERHLQGLVVQDPKSYS